MGASCPPQYFRICKKVGQELGRQAGRRGLATAFSMTFFLVTIVGQLVEQPWASSNTFDSDQHGPGFEAQRRPFVTPGRASGPKCACQN